MTNKVIAFLVLAAGIYVGAQGCGSTSSGTSASDYKTLCNQSCDKINSCIPDSGGFFNPTTCKADCTTQAAMTCSNQATIVSMAKSCLAMSDCTAFIACGQNIPDCIPTGGTGAGGSGTGAGGSTTGAGGSGTGAGGSTTGAGGSGGCSCSTGMECTTDGRCVDPRIIDDFADCNTAINLVRGRNGGWYAAGDVGINISFAVSAPPSGFTDRRCGAWTTGGPTGNGTTNYALMGVAMTSNSTPVSFAGFTGISLTLEGQAIDFTIKTTNGGYFTKRLTQTSGTATMTIPFSSLLPRSDSTLSALDLTQILDIQFTVIDPTMGYGFVIHGVALY